MTAPTTHTTTSLSRLMTDRDLTGRALAGLAGVHENTVYGALAGRRPMRPVAYKLAAALGVAVTDLWPELAATPLAAAMAERGLSATDVAAIAGVSQSTARNWVAGHARPKRPEAIRLAAAGLPPGRDDIEVDLEALRRAREAVRLLAGTPPTVHEVLSRPATGAAKWEQQALCATRDVDPDAWWPKPDQSGLDAARVCGRCPVLGDCRDTFLARPWPDRSCVVAGMTGKALLRAAKRRGQEAA
jgi:transcriptional regulator with XRE-family HTH domain